MLVQIQKAFEGDVPETQIIGSIVDASNWANTDALIEGGYIKYPDATQAGAYQQHDANELVAELQSQLAAVSQDNQGLKDALAALQAQVEALGTKGNRKAN